MARVAEGLRCSVSDSRAVGVSRVVPPSRERACHFGRLACPRADKRKLSGGRNRADSEALDSLTRPIRPCKLTEWRDMARRRCRIGCPARRAKPGGREGGSLFFGDSGPQRTISSLATAPLAPL